jgi:membrane protein implicated in regulation of membrane protease activity
MAAHPRPEHHGQVLFILGIVLLFVLPYPWNVTGLTICLVLGLGELFLWNRTVRHRRAVVDVDTLIGRTATVTAPCRPVGQIRLDGETWEARCEAGADPGDTVRVIGRKRLTLVVEPG